MVLKNADAPSLVFYVFRLGSQKGFLKNVDQSVTIQKSGEFHCDLYIKLARGEKDVSVARLLQL